MRASETRALRDCLKRACIGCGTPPPFAMRKSASAPPCSSPLTLRHVPVHEWHERHFSKTACDAAPLPQSVMRTSEDLCRVHFFFLTRACQGCGTPLPLRHSQVKTSGMSVTQARAHVDAFLFIQNVMRSSENWCRARFSQAGLPRLQHLVSAPPITSENECHGRKSSKSACKCVSRLSTCGAHKGALCHA